MLSGVVLLAMSFRGSSGFHRGFGVVALVAFGATVALGRLDVEDYVSGLPTYFGIVAVLLVLSLAGYPLRAARYEAQILSLISALASRGARPNTIAGVMGQMLGSVLDVGSLALTDVVFSRSAPAGRLDALKWAARSFSFVPLWSNLNLLTATAIVLTGTTYLGFLSLSGPFLVLGMAALLFVAQREKSLAADSLARSMQDVEPLDRRIAAVLLYPVVLIVAVACLNVAVPSLTLTSSIALTVVVVVVGVSLLAAVLLGRRSPVTRLVRESRASLASSRAEFALFGSAGVLIVSLQSLGFLSPLGDLLAALPQYAVPFALAIAISLGFAVGIHVLPMILLIDAAFPLSETSTPALWALALILGSQGALLMTPFSASVMMLTRITGLGSFEVGPKTNARFSVTLGVCAFSYLALMTLIFTPR